MIGAEDLLTVELISGDRLWHGTGRDYDVRRFQLLLPFGSIHDNFAGTVEPSKAFNDIHLSLLEQSGEPVDQLVDDPVFAGQALAPIKAGRVGLNSEVTRVLDGREDTGRLQPGLGRYAAPKEAGTTDTILFDHRHSETEVVGVEGGGVAPRATPDNGDVVHLRASLSLADPTAPPGVSSTVPGIG